MPTLKHYNTKMNNIVAMFHSQRGMEVKLK